MRISRQAIDFLVGWDGCELKMYKDQSGLPTIGIVHLLTQLEYRTGIIYLNGRKVAWKNGLTEAMAYELKAQDLEHFEMSLSGITGLKQHQYDALVILAFNIGVGAFMTSTVYKRIKAGNLDVTEPWGLFNKITMNGKKVVSNGLVKRRNAEIAIFLNDDYSRRP